ncbi:MAG TPA: hypothetical protein VFD70_18460 [Anaerolineae bacterium]|nr:hypothetical protein [Anaerolineae bacterium]
MKPPLSRPSSPLTATDLELLRAFEPVVKYTKGEQFYSMDVERYIQVCSLWAHYPDGREELLIPKGQLTLEKLVQHRSLQFGAVEYLRFVMPQTLGESVGALSDRNKLHRAKQNVFKAGQGRLARGGLLPRIADALFSLTLLARGRVPGAIAAQAELQYDEMQQRGEKFVYHGRVARQNGWTILQYWFFMAFNSWRSGFHGVNDHESDWEMIMVYLYELDGRLYPEWVAYASHDFHGDDLRRRWDDQSELDLINGHPVVYAGAGSHASYFRPGEYQAEVGLPLPNWLAQGARIWSHFWRQTLGIGSGEPENPFRIPFVDFARGDGLSIGPGAMKEWTPNVISEATPWVSEYQGLWGLYARDPISGENAPAGPMYNRDGSPRSSWYDPLGFSGLDKVPPPPQELPLVEERIADLSTRQEAIQTELEPKSRALEELGIQMRAMQGNTHLAIPYEQLQRQANILSEQVKALRREHSENAALLGSLERRAAKLRANIPDDPQAHILHLGKPVSTARMRFNRLAEFWAAVSISVLLLGIVALAIFYPSYLFGGILFLIFLFIMLESLLRGTYVSTINNLAVILAVISIVGLLFRFGREFLLAALVVAAIFLLLQKLRELRE